MRLKVNKALLVVMVLATIIAQIGLSQQQAHAVISPFGERSMTLSDDRVSQTAQYLLSLQKIEPGIFGSLKIEFCSNNAVFGTPCVAPVGFDASAAVLSDQTGITDFTLMPSSANNIISIARTPSFVPQTQVTYTFQGIVNPTTNGTYFVRVYSYPSGDVSGSYNTAGGLAFSINSAVTVNATVPPYLTFCTGTSIPIFDCSSATGNYIDFGELTSTHTRSGTAQIMTTTNADGGYSVRVVGTTMTAGNNVINALDTAATAKTGVAQFGLNLRNNSAPFVGAEPDGLGVGTPAANYSNPDHYKFTSGDVVASAPQPDLYRRYTISYIVNVPKAQPAGVYVTTLTYICLANF